MQVTYLSNIGGENLGSIVRRILACVLTNDLAKQYNWVGKGTKEALCKLRFVNVVHRKYIHLIILYCARIILCLPLCCRNLANAFGNFGGENSVIACLYFAFISMPFFPTTKPKFLTFVLKFSDLATFIFPPLCIALSRNLYKL